MNHPRAVAIQAARYLTRRGFLGVTSDKRRVYGIPFVEMTVYPFKSMPPYHPVEGVIHIQWLVYRTLDRDVEDDVVRLRAADFVPMLEAWVEQERKRRV